MISRSLFCISTGGQFQTARLFYDPIAVDLRPEILYSYVRNTGTVQSFRRRKDRENMSEFISSNISVLENGHLAFAGQDTVALAQKYGTPLYLFDEARIRSNMRMYKTAFAKYFPAGSRPFYASKACSFRQIYRIAAEEEIGIDVVSSGEIYTALSAGFDLKNACFHSNNKTDEDIRYAIENGIGCFAADNAEEIRAIEREAAAAGIVQEVMLRLTPGIDPHTYDAVATGKVDSKFGSAIETGQAEELTAYTLRQPHIKLTGFHCHVGSMVFGEDVYERAAAIMLGFIRDMRDRYGFTAENLDMGGGYGVRYTQADPQIDIPACLERLAAEMTRLCAELGIDMPKISMEPGRSIAADAGMTLYTVGTLKKIPGYKNYVSVDGGMTDNPRYALYGSKYSCYTANKMTEEASFKASLVGRCCESGDIVQPDVLFPQSIQRGDIEAVCTTGAYNYSMASNYNRVARPAIVMLRDGQSYVAVRRESLADICRNDI